MIKKTVESYPQDKKYELIVSFILLILRIHKDIVKRFPQLADRLKYFKKRRQEYRDFR